jgi:hypothetical protein
MQPEALFRIRLVVGDWSTDGHSMAKEVSVLSNRRDRDLSKAYAKGVRVVGVDLTKDVCREYEDSSLPAEVLVKLTAAGYQIPGVEHPETAICEDTEYLTPEEFAELWLFIARKGDPELRVEVVEGEPSINIGGYGLFVR